jgi:hypothetical protein
VAFEILGPVPAVRLVADLIGDGLDGTTVDGVDLRAVRSLWVRAARAGRYWLQLRVEDACGRTDATAVQRWVEVRE